MFRFVIGIILRVCFIVVWVLIAPLVLLVACYQRRDKLWDWCYYFDNDEEGFDGDDVGWYSKYLGKSIDKDKWLHRTYISYKWSALRNPCYNLRYHPWLSVDVQSPVDMKYRGNTYFHTRGWHYDKDYKGTLWYWITAKYEGNTHHSMFFLIPIVFTSKSLYFRIGLKIYPRHYFDKYWLDRIKKEGWPKNKEKGVPAISIRLR